MSASIEVDRVSLSLPIFVQRSRRTLGWTGMLLGAAFDPPRREFTRLLHDISFTAREGDRIAVLGRNGAGKSTLLRVLNGVYAPTAGHVRMTGTCQALLNITLGFNNEATVRENIFLRGTAMGIRAAYLKHEIDPILEFAGLQDKANHRLRTLSAGQRMRLGFTISTSFQHDIILMDEWMGAGDSEFTVRATERMQSRVGGSKIVMLASHSIALLRSVCNKGVVLEKGRMAFAGDIVLALKVYHDIMAGTRGEMIQEMPTSSSVPASTYGFVEAIGLTDGVLTLQGWFVNTEGRVPSGLALEFGGQRHEATIVRHVPRPDVMRHLGLSSDNCGFVADFLLHSIAEVAEIGSGMRVLAGEDLSPDCPLHIAAGVKFQVEASI